MKNKLKKIFKIFLKVLVVVLIIYVIYVVTNVIYANSIIDKLVKAVEEADTKTLYGFNNDSIDDISEYIRNTEELSELKVFSYEKIKTRYYLGKVRFYYDIKIANPDIVLENGIHTQNLLENIDDIYIKERQIEKEVLKKLGIYNKYSEEVYINKYDAETSLDEKVFFDLIMESAYKDEEDYGGTDIKTVTVPIEYNIFTHEFRYLEDFYDIKHGELLINLAKRLHNEDYLKECMSYFSMCKQGEKPIIIVSLNDKFVSLYEVDEENKINEKEKYFIENKMTLDEIEKYLLNEGYIYDNFTEFEK